MEIEGFVARNAPRWRRLEALLDRLERRGPRALSPEELRELLDLYRGASSDLAEARTFTASPELLDMLSQVVGRGYKAIYRTRLPRFLAAAAAFFARDLPLAARRRARATAVAAAALIAGILFGFLATWADRRNAALLLPSRFYIEHPAEHVAERETGAGPVPGPAEAIGASAMLFTHNIRVSFFAFSLGILAGALSGLYIFWTGGLVGAMAALFHAEGVALFFYGWVAPHGVLELPAVVLASASGILLGHAWMRPGTRTRRASLREALPDAGRLLAGAAALLVVAGSIEGTLSQLTRRAVPYGAKIGFAAVLLAGLLFYLYAMPVPHPGGRGRRTLRGAACA